MHDSFPCTMFVDSHADRSIGEKKPRISSDEGPSMAELSGYNTKRQEFEIEYDNDAEQLLADMEFKEMDTEAERELKLRVLRIYSKRYSTTFDYAYTLHATNQDVAKAGKWYKMQDIYFVCRPRRTLLITVLACS